MTETNATVLKTKGLKTAGLEACEKSEANAELEPEDGLESEAVLDAEGAYFRALASYIIVERSGQMVKRIFFSAKPPEKVSDLAEKIIAYTEGDLPLPEADLDLSGFTDFQRRVYAAVRGIPRGSTLTYGEVALLAGSPGAARAVGHAMAKNPFIILVPCHRVVAKSGLGGFGYGLEAKKRLLEIESGRGPS